jgi:hypothetical protein
VSVRIPVLLIFVMLVLVASAAGTDDLAKKYGGKSDCIPELKAASSTGIRLDRSQKAYLTAYALGDASVVTIVQYHDDAERCGTIRDVVQAEGKDDAFIWDCVDKRAPSAVVVGTWPAKHPKVTGPAVEAWRIDLKELRFIPVKQPSRFVRCSAPSYAGSDQGDGLSDWARKRADRVPHP